MAWPSVATGHQEVKCAFVKKAFVRDRRHIGRIPIAVGRRGATLAVVVVSSQFVGKCVCFLFKMNRRVPNYCENTARLENESCVCGVVVIEHFRVQLCTRRFKHYPSMSFSRWVVVVRCGPFRCCCLVTIGATSWHVVHALHSMLLLLFSHFASFILSRVVCACFEVCFVVSHVCLIWVGFEQIDVVSANSVT